MNKTPCLATGEPNPRNASYFLLLFSCTGSPCACSCRGGVGRAGWEAGGRRASLARGSPNPGGEEGRKEGFPAGAGRRREGAAPPPASVSESSSSSSSSTPSPGTAPPAAPRSAWDPSPPSQAPPEAHPEPSAPRTAPQTLSAPREGFPPLVPHLLGQDPQPVPGLMRVRSAASSGLCLTWGWGFAALGGGAFVPKGLAGLTPGRVGLAPQGCGFEPWG